MENLINNPYLLAVVIPVALLGPPLSLLSLWRIAQFRKKQSALLEGEDAGRLADIVARQKQVISAHNKSLHEIARMLEEMTAQNRLVIGKIGFVRFNPFPETGGNMSFALALLNADKNGIVISSLHSREGTRIYAKPVEKGESKHHLTDEERQAIAEAN